jgi:hypothetical protein
MVKVNEELLKAITDQLKGIQYGALLITVHNDEITQLDVTSKQRFDDKSALQKSKFSRRQKII